MVIMSDLEFEIDLPTDEAGFTGRECPECEQYFKVDPVSAVAVDNENMFCVYCGHEGDPQTFLTPNQVEYVQEEAQRQAAKYMDDQLGKALKGFGSGSSRSSKSGFSIEITKTNSPGMSNPIIPTYREKPLTDEHVCSDCHTRYAVEKEHGYCPGCGKEKK